MRANPRIADSSQAETAAILNPHIHDCRQLLEAKKGYPGEKSELRKHNFPSPTESTAKRAKSLSISLRYPEPAVQSMMQVYNQPTYFNTSGADAGRNNLDSRNSDEFSDPFHGIFGSFSDAYFSSNLAGSGYITNSGLLASLEFSNPYEQPGNLPTSDLEFSGNLNATQQLDHCIKPTAISGQIDKVHPADFLAIQKMKGKRIFVYPKTYLAKAI